MGIVRLNGPPDAPGGTRWCPICLMRAKQKQWEISADDRAAGDQAPGDKVTIIPWPAGLTAELQAGWYRGVAGSYPMLGVIDGLCWDDLAGIEPSEPVPESPPLLQANGPLPPGLRPKGRGPVR